MWLPTMRRKGDFALTWIVRKLWLWIAILVISVVLGGVSLQLALPMYAQSQPSPLVTRDDIFTPEHRTVFSAIQEYFGWRDKPVQQIAFSHQLHLQKGLQCNSCHAGVDRGPDARIPGVTTCMVCHQTIATSRPEIQKLKGYRERGEDVPWQRVYGFVPSAHVRFNHAPHIRAGVACAACHGNMAMQTVALRQVNHTMGFCMDCHLRKSVSTDCMTCHY